MDQLPNRLRELRKARELTLEQVADRVGMGITMLSDLERGDRDLTYHWMKLLSRFYKVKIADLLGPQDNSQSLSADEHDLIAMYRQGDEQQRRQLVQMARLLVGEPEKRGRGRPRKAA